MLITEGGIIRFIAIPRLGLSLSLLYDFCNVLFLTGFLILFVYLIYWCIANRINKGLKYALCHAYMMKRIRKSMKSAGYYIEENFRAEKVAVLPKIYITFSKDFTYGKVVIENHIKLNKRLETVDISSALGRYIVSQHYIDDDANTYVFEFEDARTNNQLVFNSYDEFVKYASQVGNYVLFMDKKNKVDLCGMLIVGSTGSGKTYAVYTLILTMLNWKIKPNIYFADPKNSSLVVLGNAICPEKTAGTIEDIISLLERFHDEMQNRKIEMQDKLNEKLDADYRYWNMPANIFVFDEFAAFQSVIDSMDKKTRDHVSMLLRNIVLEGRQLGYFAALIMQKSDATDLKSSIRANLPWVVVLGNATRTTYLTAFEETADLPNRNFRRGEGLFSYQGVTRQPQITSCIYRPDRAHCTAL